MDIRVVHMRDLNFVLRSKIFVNSNEQLQTLHLILVALPFTHLGSLSGKLYWWTTLCYCI